MRGILLCGGASRRMGRRKEWLTFDERPLLLHTLETLQEICSEVVVVAAEERELERLVQLNVRAVLDEYAGQGPLAGLHAGLTGLPADEKACLVACDLPFLQAGILQDLAQVLEEQPGLQAVVPQEGERLYPVCALYHGQVREIAASCLQNGENAMKRFLAKLQVGYVPIERYAAYEPPPFLNMNTPADYERARTLWKKEGR
ncbi:molybdopterin-guanine dinucleotide biosynthesis protein A [Tumebacillus sp. BK434]|uniref:molybdenum cofactor guanylyltransferase n=1 Tax=Tumebacillus sp. BK434 TaxID=2512169 RepID=UPI00104F0542|nr:molybdenum cofactor guanylyltransferase [Tumebacillus sp. BK434]TCP52393.1 molybdopterin-guanine dinucleotide biosynthesis protein A [Tumebacillus sp. BK434]